MTAACVGMWALFDSIDVADHIVARRLCETCPMLTDCRRLLREAKEAADGAGHSGGPQGTWAGQLIGGKDIGYRTPGVPDEVLTARAAYARGDRSEWAVTGNRAYERDRWRRRRRKAVA